MITNRSHIIEVVKQKHSTLEFKNLLATEKNSVNNLKIIKDKKNKTKLNLVSSEK